MILKETNLKTALIIPFISLTILAVGLVGYLSYLNGRKAVNDASHTLLAKISEHIQDHLYSFIKTPQQINLLNAHSMQLGFLNAADQDALERYFRRQIEACELVSSITFGNPQGGIVNSGREEAPGSFYVIASDNFTRGSFRKYSTDDEGQRTELILTADDYDACKRDWYKRAVEKGGGVWSNIYVLFTGRDMAIASSRPVYNGDGNLLGVASIELFFSHMNDFLKKLVIGNSGQAFIMERSGLLIASSSSEDLYRILNENRKHQRISARESSNVLIKNAGSTLLKMYDDYRNIKEDISDAFRIKGERHFLNVASVKDEYGLDWLVVVVLPESDFFSQIQANNKLTVALIVGAIIIVVFACIIIAQRITEPILNLNRSAEKLAKGNWKHEIKENCFIIEINALINSFNQTAKQLQNMLDSLQCEVSERKKKEESLRLSEERLDLALAGANEGIWDWRIHENIMFFDTRYYTMAGYKPNEFPWTFEEWEARVHKADIERAKSAISQYLAGALDNFEMEFRYLRRDGSYMWIQSKGKIVARDDQGNPTRFIGTHNDITGRKQAEKALRDNEQLLKNILESMDEGIFLLDNEFKNKVFNKGMEVITHTQRQDVFNKVPWEPFPFLKDSMFEENMRKAMKGEAVIGMEEFLPLPHNPNSWTKHSCYPLRDADGQIDGVVSVVSDITEQKEAEAALRKYEQIVSTSQDRMALINRDYVYEAVNDSFFKSLNKKREEIVGHTIAEVMGEDIFREKIQPQIDRAFSGKVVNYQEIFVNFINSSRTMDVTFFPMLDEAGKTEGAVLNARDITERKRIEEKLHKHEQQLRTLAEVFPGVLCQFCMKPDGTFCMPYASHGILELSGLSHDDIKDDMSAAFSRVHPDDYEGQMDSLLASAQTLFPWHSEFRILHPGKGDVWIEGNATPERQPDGSISWYGFIHDITDRKLNEEALNTKRLQLAELASELAIAEEQERQIIAAMLHDHIGQTLLLGRIKLGTLVDEKMPTTHIGTVEEIKKLLDQVAQSIQKLTVQLSPPILATAGLEAAFEWLGRRMEEDYGLFVEFDDDMRTKPLSDEVRSVVYQCGRELLINVAKHAKADAARIAVALEGNRYRVTVEDDGIGFDPAVLNHDSSKTARFGLLSLQIRMERLGGEVIYESSPGQGSQMALLAPLANKDVSSCE